jgi:hypothetical protein
VTLTGLPVSIFVGYIFIKPVMPDSHIACTHASLGCEWQGKHEELKSHLQNCAIEPLKSILYRLSNRVGQLTEEVERLKRELEDFKIKESFRRPSVAEKSTNNTDLSIGGNDTSDSGNMNRMSISSINNPWQLDQPLAWDRAASHPSTEFSNEDCTITGKERNVTVIATQPMRKGGIYYFEIKIERDGIPTRIGLVAKDGIDPAKSIKDQGWSCGSAGDLWIQGERVGVDFLTWKSGDTIGVLVDMVDKVLWLYKNKALKGVAFKYFPDDMYPAVTVNNGTCTINFNAHVEVAPDNDTTSGSNGPVRTSKTRFKNVEETATPTSPESPSDDTSSILSVSAVSNPWDTNTPLTWDKSASHASFATSDDLLTCVGKERNVTAVATQGMANSEGKYYFEFKDVKNGMPSRLGFVEKIDGLDTSKSIKDIGWSCGSGGDVWIKGEQVRTDFMPWRSGDRIGFLVDIEERTIYIYKNGQCKGMVFQFFPDNLFPAATINFGTCTLDFNAVLEHAPTRDDVEVKMITRKKTRKPINEQDTIESPKAKPKSNISSAWDRNAPLGWDKAASHGSFQISEDLKTLVGKERNVCAIGTQPMKNGNNYYFEIEDVKDGVPTRIGMVDKGEADVSKSVKDIGWSCGSAGDLWIKGEKVGSDFLTWKSGDKVGVLVNVAERTVCMFKNGVFKGVAFKYFPDDLYPAVSINQGTCKIDFNAQVPHM